MALSPTPSSVAHLALEVMESRDVPSAIGAFALVSYTPPQLINNVPAVTTVDMVRSDDIPILSGVTPFAGYTGPVAASTGDVNGDGVPDLIVAADAPNIPVKVFDGATGNLLLSFLAFPGLAAP